MTARLTPPPATIGPLLPILLGQLVSGLGSHLAVFGLAIWTLQHTGSMSSYALILLAMNLPQVVVAPFAGTLIDRWQRRTAMAFGLTGSCVCSAVLSLLAFRGDLEPSTAVVLIIFGSSFTAFTVPAYDSLIAIMAPPAQLNRVNGLVQLGSGLGYLIAPVSAGFLLPAIGLNGIHFIDVLTFVVSLAMLAVTRAPRLITTRAPAIAAEAKPPWWRGSGEGWRYVRSERGMLGLLTLGVLRQLAFGMVEILFSPLVIAFAGSQMLGLVHSTGGVGFLLGSLATAAWRGPRRLLRGMLAFTAAQGMVLFVAVAKPSVALCAAGAFGFLGLLPFIGAYFQTIWQRTTPPAIQGRVFAFRHMILQATMSFAYLFAGVLGDYVFEPLMANQGPLASTIGRVIGTGTGRGAALLMAVLGVMGIASALIGAASPTLRHFNAVVEADAPAAPDPLPTASADPLVELLD